MPSGSDGATVNVIMAGASTRLDLRVDKRSPVPLHDQAAAANSLCALGAANGISCAVVSQPGKHDWPFASHAFAAALPWLAGQIGSPDVPQTPLPTKAVGRSFEQTAAR